MTGPRSGVAAEEFRRLLTGLLEPVAIVPSDDHQRYLVDERRRIRADAWAVVRPGSTEQVAAVMELCAGHDVAVVPQGGNTGLCGGSVPQPGSSRPTLVLSTSRLNRIRDLNPVRATATVEAGVTIQAVQEAAAGADLLFGPDWGARGTAQIGGAISTNAGGLNVIRWGGLRRQVLGLEVVLPDGRVWDGLRPLYKDSSGVDLKQLFIGAEGTLGVVTAAVVALQARPADHHSALVALPDIDTLLPFFTHVRGRANELLSGFELLPAEGIARAVADVPSLQAPTLAAARWYALVRYSGDDGTDDRVAQALTDVLAAAADRSLITDAVVAATPVQEQNLWYLREELPSGRRFDERGRRHKFDIAVPVDMIPPFIRRADTVVDQVVPGVRTYIFGHVGDGNLHFSLYPGPDADLDRFDDAGAELVSAVDRLTWEFGGSISAEHGIGQEMRARLVGQKSDLEFELLARLKNTLDPQGIMNPGKVLPESWDRPVHEVRSGPTAQRS
ncbi:MAG: FAD-binding oxidoreductase [Acidimicrobiia bacterium]|nr:FAD-binding oxidoreductase [Acidimicrobiia bacterium]